MNLKGNQRYKIKKKLITEKSKFICSQIYMQKTLNLYKVLFIKQGLFQTLNCLHEYLSNYRKTLKI